MESKPLTKVIIAGAGIAGPVLAMFLKAKGYDPVVYERVDKLDDAGLSLCLQPNGLKVLSLIPGFLESIIGKQISHLFQVSYYPSSSPSEVPLADLDGPSHLPDLTGGFGMLGVRRPVFNRTIVEAAERQGVKIVWGHQLVALKQGEDEVQVTFANGATDTASFVVGCDGLHSNTRICLFGEEEVNYTGLCQTGGVSPTPESHKGRASMTNIYSDGAHMVSYSISNIQTSWAITLREPEARENWRAMDEEKQREFRESTFSQWPFGAGELVRSADRIVKYGLYDRPELKSWHQGRVVLLGDAAHPTSPHLGQGANQAFEDIYHLVRLLTTHNPSAAPPSTALLSKIFTEYESLRIARTSMLVQGARQQGESRVVSGAEACKMRDEAVRKALGNEEALLVGTMMVYREPFDGESEI